MMRIGNIAFVFLSLFIPLACTITSDIEKYKPSASQNDTSTNGNILGADTTSGTNASNEDIIVIGDDTDGIDTSSEINVNDSDASTSGSTETNIGTTDSADTTVNYDDSDSVADTAHFSDTDSDLPLPQDTDFGNVDTASQDSEPQFVPDTVSDVNTGIEVDTATASGTGTGIESGTGTETETDTGTETETDTGTEIEAGTGTETETGTGTETEADTGTETGTDSDTGTGSIEPEIHIYLAVGQSNMQGAAPLPAQYEAHPRVLVMQSENCPSSDDNPYSYGEWRGMFPPLIKCKASAGATPIGLGPADSFAVAMAEAAPEHVTIGIVGAAYGDTSIEMHLPNCSGDCLPNWGSNVDGAPEVEGTTLLYDWILDLALRAQESGVIKGIIFHQGENNAGDETWPDTVNAYVTALRADLGLDPDEVPFIAGELPYTGFAAQLHNPLVRQISDSVQNGHWVSAGPTDEGTVLGDRGDGFHWSTFSVTEMGRRYAAKMLEAQELK